MSENGRIVFRVQDMVWFENVREALHRRHCEARGSFHSTEGKGGKWS